MLALGWFFFSTLVTPFCVIRLLRAPLMNNSVVSVCLWCPPQHTHTRLFFDFLVSRVTSVSVSSDMIYCQQRPCLSHFHNNCSSCAHSPSISCTAITLGMNYCTNSPSTMPHAPFIYARPLLSVRRGHFPLSWRIYVLSFHWLYYVTLFFFTFYDFLAKLKCFLLSFLSFNASAFVVGAIYLNHR